MSQGNNKSEVLWGRRRRKKEHGTSCQTGCHQLNNLRMFSFSRFKDNEMEERAQRAINDFFSKNLVGKSPWSEDGKPKPIVYLSPSPSTPGKLTDDL